MATSLQRQLAAAAAPASSILQPERKRVSIIFSQEEAAKFDKETFYHIGLDGLNELISVCPDLFIPFKSSILFSPASKQFERVVENAETNERLDDLIDKFLLTLSPYLMLKASLKCMEWLVYRFHIERLNIESIIECILPFYDTKHFLMIVQILQLTNFKNKTSVDWQWLAPCVQSAGVLRKATLFGNVNGPFILWLFQTLRKFLEIHQYHQDNLSTFFGFVVSTCLGIITKFGREFSMQGRYPKSRNKKSVVDTVLSQIQKLFYEAMNDPALENLRLSKDFYSMAYIIIAAVGITAEENPEIGNVLSSKIKRIFNLLIANQNVVLMEETYILINMLVNHIYFDWSLKQEILLEQALMDLALVSENWDVSSVASKLILANVKEQLNPTKLFRYLANIHLRPEERAEILAKTYFTYKENKKIKWSKKLLVQFERKYPSEFEYARESYPNLAEDFAQLSTEENVISLANHPEEHVRAEAVNQLIKSAAYDDSNKGGAKKKKLMKTKKALLPDKNPIAEVLIPRFHDDSKDVLEALLSWHWKRLLQIFSPELLLEGCITVVKRKVAFKPVKMAIMKICELANKIELVEKMEKQIMTLLIPFLFPRKPAEERIAKKIIGKKFAKKSVLLQKYSSCDFDIYTAKARKICVFSYDVLTNLGNDIKFNLLDFNSPTELVIALLMTTNENDLVRILESLFKFGIRSTSDFPVTPKKFAKSFSLADKQGIISLELVLSLVLKVDVRQFANQLSIIKYAWNLSEDESNRGTCMTFIKEFIKKTFEDSSRQFWFWLAALHPLSSTQDNVEPDSLSEFYLIRCLQFFSNFVREFGIPARISSEEDEISIIEEVSNEVHKPLTRSKGKADNVVLPKDGSKRAEKRYGKDGKEINRARISPSWCLLEVLLSQCLQHPSRRVRLVCINFAKIIKAVPRLSADWCDLLEKILAYEKEIIADQNQVGSIIGRIIVDADLSSVRAQIIRSLISSGLNKDVFMGLANICQHTGSLLYNELEPLILRLLEADPESNQLIALLSCFEASPKSLEILPRLLEIKGPAKVVLKKMNNRLFTNSNPDFKKSLFCLMIDAAVTCKVPEIKLLIQRCVRKWDVDSVLISEELKRCLGAERLISAAGVRRKAPQAEPANTNASDFTSDSDNWKLRAEVVLEFLQGMKKLNDTKLLLPPLFRILKLCISLEEQSPVEYLKQLTLTGLTLCCSEDIEDDQKIDNSTFHVDLVIDCLRCSRNPQTHHHALILLNYAAKRFQEQVLHGVMSLFTFMGNSILRQDDTYSTQLIQQTVTTIIPALTKAGRGGQSEVSRTVISASIFRVFASALQDIPVHRRLPVFTSLVETLDPEESLWQVLIIIVDNALNRDRKKSNLNADLELAVELAWSWGPSIVISTMAQMYKFFISMPQMFTVFASEDDFKRMKVDQTPIEKAVFDFSRKDTYKDIQVALHYIVELLLKIATKFAQTDIEEKLSYDVLVERCLSFSRIMSSLTEEKIFRIIGHKNFDVLEKVNMVLEAVDFVRVISVILERRDTSIKRKVLDMFNLRLAQKVEWFGDLNILLPLLRPLTEVASLNPETEDIVTLVQTAFLSIKLIAKHLAHSHPDEFVSVFHLALEYATHEKQLLCASALLCIGELFCLKSLLLPRLNDITSAILRAFKTSYKLYQVGNEMITEEQSDPSVQNGGLPESVNESVRQEGNSSITTSHLLCVSTIACMNKMAEQLGPMMGSKFLKKALTIILTIDSMVSSDVSASRKKIFEQRLRILLKTIATKIPVRNSLIPLKGAFHDLLEIPKAAKSVMQILKDSLQVTSKPDFILILPPLCEAFIEEFLGARYNLSLKPSINLNEGDLQSMEDSVIDCLISGAVLKMSEGTFRPYYHKLFDWARESEAKLITFYRFSAGAAERLKSLFVTFAGYVMNEAVGALNQNLELTKGVLSLFYQIFSNDREGFVTTDRFNTLVKPLVELMESDYILQGQIELKALTNTLIQLAVASNDLNRWQHMMDLISTKAHHSNKIIRLNVIRVLEAAASELGKDFLPLLPPVVPFLAELLNDDDADVEAATQAMILKLEEIVGEPLQPYFT